MENLTHALFMAFAMMTFVIAFSVSLYLINQLNTTTETVISHLDGSFYDSLSLTEMVENNEERNRSRIVGIDTIIPTLYRYYKESFSVKILDEKGNLLQYFDTTAEGDVNAAKATIDSARTDKQKALMSLYDADNKACFMSGAPWLANINKDAKTRIDMYINGGKGYINNTLVDYSKEFSSAGLSLGTVTEANKIYLNNFKDRKFKEIFTQYSYEGDTITDETNGEITTLTGSHQVSTKIIIIYQLLP